MKAFAMLGIGSVGWIEKEKPVAGPYDAIVKPIALAPCTSDIHTIEGAIGDRKNLVLGHESVGEVVEVGSEVKYIKPGDRVVVPAITPDWRSVELQDTGLGQHSGGMLAGWKFSNIKDGVFSEYFHVNDGDMNLAVLPDGITLEAAVMLTDMATTGLHGVELANVEYGDTVVVLGIGPVGLMSVAGAQLMGAGRIVGVGSRPALIEAAKFYGATDIVNYRERSVVDRVLEMTNNRGADKVIVAGGNCDILIDAVKILKAGGAIGNINYFGGDEFIPIPREAWGVGMGHKAINGGLTPGGRVRMERLIELVKYGRLDPGKLVTHLFHGFDKIEEALQLMKEKPADLIKPVVLID